MASQCHINNLFLKIFCSKIAFLIYHVEKKFRLNIKHEQNKIKKRRSNFNNAWKKIKAKRRNV